MFQFISNILRVFMSDSTVNTIGKTIEQLPTEANSISQSKDLVDSLSDNDKLQIQENMHLTPKQPKYWLLWTCVFGFVYEVVLIVFLTPLMHKIAPTIHLVRIDHSLLEWLAGGVFGLQGWEVVYRRNIAKYTQKK